MLSSFSALPFFDINEDDKRVKWKPQRRKRKDKKNCTL